VTAATLPRVTEILAHTGLVDGRFFTDEARERGTAVHAAIHYEAQHDLDESSVDPKVLPYLQSYRRWVRDVQPRILRTEFECHHPLLGYVGHPDIECVIEDDEDSWIVDVKAGAPAHWHSYQTIAYVEAVGRPLQRACLYLTPTSYRFVPHIKGHEDWRIFKAALTIYRVREKHGHIYHQA
jgi:hypothetical protein